MQTQMYAPPLSKANKTILIIYVGLFILGTVLQASVGLSLSSLFGLSFSGLKTGLIFQFITYPFVDLGLMNVVFNGLILWFIGSELELKWGTLFYLKFLAVAAYSCGVIYIILSLLVGDYLVAKSLFGLTGVNLALLVAYAMIYSERMMVFMFLFPMKAKYFCLLLAGIELFMALTSSSFNAAWAHIISMAMGLIYLKYMSLKARGLGLGQIMENHRNHRANKRRQNLHLVKDDQQKPSPDDPKYWQ